MKSVYVHTQYGGVKPAEYPLVSQGYDYYEIKFGGGNMCIPKDHVEGQPLRKQNFAD
jgi:hypothetical protein